MNILLDHLPDTVDIGGVSYPIETDFRAGIQFEIMVQRKEERLAELLRPWYHSCGLPHDIEGAVDAALWFYRGGISEDTTEDKKGSEGKIQRNKEAYSYEVDADAIYTSFLSAYNIDLTTARLHWWSFRRLLAGLPEETEFKRRVYIRTCDTKNMSKKQRELIMKQRKALEIKREGQKMTLEERNRQMREYVAQRMEEAQKG